MSGDFTVINPYLSKTSRKPDCGTSRWSPTQTARWQPAAHRPIPQELKQRYATAFEIEPSWLVEAAARRQKWLDQPSRSTLRDQPQRPAIDQLYRSAWRKGPKTTYYLRSVAATHVEKSTLRTDGKLNAVPAASTACSVDDPSCEACQ